MNEENSSCVPTCSKSTTINEEQVGSSDVPLMNSHGKEQPGAVSSSTRLLEDTATARKYIPVIIARDAPRILITSDDHVKEEDIKGAGGDAGGGGGTGEENSPLVAYNNDRIVQQIDPQLTISSLRSLGILNSVRKEDNGLDGEDWDDYRIPSWNAYTVSDPATQLTVKSIASLGLGSSDGRNLYVRRVPSSASILINNKDAVRRTLRDDDEFSESSSVYSSTDSGYRFRRKHWRSKTEFILACIGFTIGLGNVWRFPYLCFKSGAFLIPYFATLFLCAMPLLYMELAVGQFTRRGPVGAMGRICPLFKGTGIASLVISFIMSTYSVVLIAWALYYLVASFNADLPWSSCGNEWNTEHCYDPANVTEERRHSHNRSSITQEFYDGKVLQRSSGIEEPGVLRNELVLCLFFAWVLVYFALWKSVRSSGKVVYFTATFPYVLLIAFLAFSLTLPGADRGLRYFFKPRWDLLYDAKVWINAAAQNFNAVGLAMGSIMTFSSYNRFSNNILTDTVAITLVNAFTSILVGITVFALLGHIALEQKTSIENVVADGPGLVFVVYPQGLLKMPVPHFWTVLFFFMLLCVALNHEFVMVEVVVTSIRDGFPRTMHKYFKRHELLVLVVCVVSFLVGLPNVMQGGIYIFQLLDDYTAKFSLMYLAFFETLAVIWIYGVPRLSRNIYEMTGAKPSAYFIFCWRYAAPILLLVVWIFSFIDYEQPTYGKRAYKYPPWAEAIGWLIASCSLVTIPIFALLKLRRAEGSSWMEKLKSSVRSTIVECPVCRFTRSCTHDLDMDKDSEWNLHRNSILTTNVTPVIMSEAVFEKVSTL